MIIFILVIAKNNNKKTVFRFKRDLHFKVKVTIIPAGGSVVLRFSELQPDTGLLLSPVFLHIYGCFFYLLYL